MEHEGHARLCDRKNHVPHSTCRSAKKWIPSEDFRDRKAPELFNRRGRGRAIFDARIQPCFDNPIRIRFEYRYQARGQDRVPASAAPQNIGHAFRNTLDVLGLAIGAQ